MAESKLAFVAIGTDATKTKLVEFGRFASNENFVAEIDGDVRVVFRNYDPDYFDYVDPDDIEVDKYGKKYVVMKDQ